MLIIMVDLYLYWMSWMVLMMHNFYSFVLHETIKLYSFNVSLQGNNKIYHKHWQELVISLLNKPKANDVSKI